MESEIYAIHAATKTSHRPAGRAVRLVCMMAPPPASPWTVRPVGSKTVLQGEHAEKNSTGIKHIERRIMAIWQLFAAGIYTLDWVPSADNTADIGATSKSKVEFKRLRAMIMGYVFPRSKCMYLRDTEEATHWSEKVKKTSSPA